MSTVDWSRPVDIKPMHLTCSESTSRGGWWGEGGYLRCYICTNACCHTQRISERFGFAIQSREDFGLVWFYGG